MQVESLHGKMSLSSAPLCPCFCCFLSSLCPSSRDEGLCSSCSDRVPVSFESLSWLRNQEGGNHAVHGWGWDVGGWKGWRQCLLPRHQRHLPQGFVSLVDISLGDVFLCLILCSIADDSRNAQILDLVWGFNFYKGVFSGISL